ncbi:hypothetical protein CK203_088833 [Vitis vinifera]|uniref:Uncharacterized protein n=1 Tax=Vitis vinifera TaxID=29760 RepID=A0A438D4K7_VITVI|nr:hypothetical protein CK203_088833 [Vitis vinifera]
MVAAVAVFSPKSSLLQNPISFRGPNSSFLGGSLKGLCLQLKPRNRSRDFINLVVASASSSSSSSTNSSGGGRFYLNFTGFPFPLGPFLNRRTIRTEVVFFIFVFASDFPPILFFKFQELGVSLTSHTIPNLSRKIQALNLGLLKTCIPDAIGGCCIQDVEQVAVKDCIWLFEQEQALGFSSVSTNIRMTVIKLKSGGLWVHAPIAPTKECIQFLGGLSKNGTVLEGYGIWDCFASWQLVKELGAPVEYIILPTFAYEHKIFVGPFSRKFPQAQIWVAPRQWSWPLNLPLEFFGIFRAKTLKDEDMSTPWASEIEQKVLSSPEVGIGPYVEVAFYHKRSRTLLVTDAVIFVPRQPPECISKESLLASAKNGLAVKLLSKGKEVPEESVVDNKMNRQKGWERMVLQILFLGPSNLLEPNASFAQMSQKLIVSPIVKTLVFSKVPEKCALSWYRGVLPITEHKRERRFPVMSHGQGLDDGITQDWRFKRIIPAHFSAPINASRSDFLAAFAFLDDLLGERYVTRPSLSLLFTSLMGKAASYFLQMT